MSTNDTAVVHFGITMKLKTRGYKLTRENYAVISNKSSLGKNALYIQALNKNDERILSAYTKIYADKEGLIYRDDWCKKRLIEIMQNFDLNMEFFKRLDHVEFEHEIKQFLNKTPFFEIQDLNEYSCPGYYVLVLDDYCQIYIGTSSNIQRRARQHWAGGKLKFDRLICGQITKSKLSIDSFRALDTTRIFVYPTYNTYSQEENFIRYFSDKFLCNRISGGIMEFGQLSAVANLKTRDLD